MKNIIHFSRTLVHWLTVVSLVFPIYLFPSSALSATNVNPTITTLGPTNLVNGSYGTDTTPGPFTFIADDADNGDQVQYQIQISTSSSFTPKVVDYTSDFVQHSSLPMTFSFTVGQAAGTGSYATGSAGQTLPDDSYYWRLKAFDNHSGSSNFVAANSGNVAFKIDLTAPTIGTITGTTGTTGENTAVLVSATGSPTSAQIDINDAGYIAMTGSSSPFTYNVPVPSSSTSSISYIVKVYDAAGNFATSITKTITVTDNDSPVIGTILSAPDTTGESSTITVTATDNIAPTSAQINIAGSGYVAMTGSTSPFIYSQPIPSNSISAISYAVKVFDAAGLFATSGTQTINPTDNDKPVITLNGSTPVTIQVKSAYVDAGATATDNVNGTITSSIITSNPVNSNVISDYTVTYNVIDSAGNPADQVSRLVHVVDTTKPTISLIGANPQSIEVNTVYSELGSTVSDNYDTGLSATVDTSGLNMNVVGANVIHYNAADSSGNTATQVDRTVNVVDTTIPAISRLGDASVTTEVFSPYSDAGATATDNYDNDITSSIVTFNPVNVNVVGVYTVTYNVTDSNGNIADQVSRTVNVVDATKPVITLNGSSNLTVEYLSVYTDQGATATDNYESNLTSNIVVVNPVNTNILGDYLVTYSVSDSSGNVADQVARTVHVVDTTSPITPPSVGGTSGDNSITLTWDAVDDAVSYEVRYRPSSSTDVDDYQNVVVTSLNIDYISLSTPATTTTISGLNQGTEYEFGVRSKDSSNNLSSWTVFKKSTTTPSTTTSSNNTNSTSASTSTSTNSNSSVTTSTKTTVPNKSTTSTSSTQPVSTDLVTATVSPSTDLPPTASTVDNPTSDSSGQVKGLETQSSGSKNRNIIIYSLVFLAGIALYFIYKRRRTNSSQLY